MDVDSEKSEDFILAFVFCAEFFGADLGFLISEKFAFHLFAHFLFGNYKASRNELKSISFSRQRYFIAIKYVMLIAQKGTPIEFSSHIRSLVGAKSDHFKFHNETNGSFDA